jgi:hypothetical protein
VASCISIITHPGKWHQAGWKAGSDEEPVFRQSCLKYTGSPDIHLNRLRIMVTFKAVETIPFLLLNSPSFQRLLSFNMVTKTYSEV